MKHNRQQINARKQQASNPLHAGWGLMAPLLGMLLGLCDTLAHAQTPADYCGKDPTANFDRPVSTAQLGRYTNPTYGYSLTIPKGLTALTEASGPQRGFVVILSMTPRAVLRVDAYYDAFYDITAAGVHRRDLNAIRLHDALLSDQGVRTALAHNPGGRYLMHLQCRGDPAVLIHEEIIALRNREVYRLDLHSTPDRYANDVRSLNAMLKSWRWEAVR
jgi:hypothetical protein